MLLLLQICSYFVKRDFMKSPSRENQADITEAFNSTPKYHFLPSPSFLPLIDLGTMYVERKVCRSTDIFNVHVHYTTTSKDIYNNGDKVYTYRLIKMNPGRFGNGSFRPNFGGGSIRPY